MADSPDREALVCTRHAAERAAAVVHLKFGRGRRSLLAIGCTAPLLGLLGTVILLIDGLHAISLPGFGDCDCSVGLSETLIPFALSLPVAIFATGAFHYLTHKLETFDFEMRLATLTLLDDLASQNCSRE